MIKDEYHQGEIRTVEERMNDAGETLEDIKEYWEGQIEEVKKGHEKDELDSVNTTLTRQEVNYLVGLIEDDDDFAVSMVVNNFTMDYLEDDKNNYEYNVSNILQNIYQQWQDKLQLKLESLFEKK